MKEFVRRFGALALVIALLLTAGCSGDYTQGSISNGAKPTEVVNTMPENSLTPEEQQAEAERKEAFATSTAENDTDIGLKNIKIDTAEWTLTDEQKLVISYFDSDYFNYGDYEFLRRYPQVFDGTQLAIYGGTVKKTLSQNGDTYSLILQIGAGTENIDEYVVLNGRTGKTLFIEDDELYVYGRYQGVETVEVDGISYTVPIISVFNAYFVGDAKFDASDVKKVARVIFGDDVEVRYPVRGTEIDEGFHESVYESVYVAELEDQSNAKFSKYYLYGSGGSVTVATAPYGEQLAFSDIERHVEFSADFQHFFLFTYDWAMEAMTLEYYDQDLNKLWKREFEEITPPETEGLMTRIYDYTKNNVYCLANNELYIIDIETGEDTYTPAYVGKKIAVRKLDDGILLVSYDKSDGVMKLSLDGKIIWKTNTTGNMLQADGIQIVNDKIILEVMMMDEENYYSGTHYLVLNKEDGSVVVDAVHR